MTKKRSKVNIKKYNMGSYVSYSQQPAFGQQAPSSGQNATNVLSTAGSMAATGAGIGGPWGAAIGGVLGLGMGLFGANRKQKQYEEALNKHNTQIFNTHQKEYSDMVDVNNENPYGTYKNGGDILNPKINIEEGEMQVDPETGKVLRKFTGINPETGGKYQPHNTGGKDTKDNIVTAEEGTFIITKDKAKEYEEAVNNNDTLHQNSIMHNIRNKKRQSFKYEDGGPINFRAGMMGVTPNTSFSTFPGSISPPSLDMGGRSLNITGTPGVNWGNIGMNALNILPSVTNLIQGTQTPYQLPTMSPEPNRYRRETLANMPRELDYSPLFNRIYRDRNSIYGQIDDTTSSSAISRANRMNVNANTNRAIQDVYFQGESANNNIRSQRSSIYNQLGEADRANTNNTFNANTAINLNNLQIREGRRQQFNYGLSQLGEFSQNNYRNRQLRDRDLLTMGIIEGMYPALSPLLRQLNSSRNVNR